MALDPRRFDQIEKVVRDNGRQLNDAQSTMLARLAAHAHSSYAATAHTHAEADVASLVTDLAGKAASVHTHAATDVTGVTLHEAAYTASGGQSIPTSTDRPLAFATANYTTTDVSIGTSTGGAIGNAAFTLNRGGLWIVEGGVRIGNAVAGKSYGIWLGPDGGSTRYRAQFVDAGGTDAMEFAVAVCSRFSAGTVLNLNFWHDEGVARSTVLLNGGNSIRFAWLRP
jgi:hypothetical protein